MDHSFITRGLTQAYKDELHNYDIFPKVVPSGKTTTVTVKPLGGHAAFTPGTTYHIRVRPLDEGSPGNYPDRPNNFVYPVTPDGDGCLRFSFPFFGEQEFFIRIEEDDRTRTELCVFAVGPDLVGRYPFRGDLHLHSYRSDGKQAPEIVCAEYRKTGLDFLALTDHERYYPSLDAIAAYRDVPIELTIVPGEEVQLPCDHDGGHINDIHLINFGGEYSVNGLIAGGPQETETGPGDAVARRAIIPNPPARRSREEYWAEVDAYARDLVIPPGVERFAYASCHWIFNEVRKGNGLSLFAHPYWIANVLHVPPSFVDYMMETHPFDAFEVLGGETYFEQNGFQTIEYYEDRAKGRHYPVVGCTDSHSAFNNRKGAICATLVFSPENERRALIRSIKDFYSVAVDTISPDTRFVGELRLCRYACFLMKEFFPLHDELCFEEGRAMKDYVTGEKGAREMLEAMAGRMKAQREKYFAF